MPGRFTPRTLDLASKSYLVALTHQGDDAYGRALMERVRAMMQINASLSLPAWLKAQIIRFVDRAGPKQRWLAHLAGRITIRP